MTDYSLVDLELIPVAVRNFSHSHRVRTACSHTHLLYSCQKLSLSNIQLTDVAQTPSNRFLSSPKAETISEGQQPPSEWLQIIISLKIKLLDYGYSLAIYCKRKAIYVHAWTGPEGFRISRQSAHGDG